MNMTNIGERIRLRRKELKLTQAELGKRLGISASSVTQWESGNTTPNGANTVDLCKVLLCSSDWLVHGKGEKELSSSNCDYVTNAIKHYPLINYVAAGSWTTVINYDQEFTESFPCPVRCSNSTFVLRVKGDSMLPLFSDSDLIFVDPEAAYRNGSYVVATCNGDTEATFKQLIIESRGMYLKPANPNWPIQVIELTTDCKIVGVVVFSGRQFM